MAEWMTTMDRIVRVEGVWLRVSAVDALTLTTAGKTRAHLRGGGVVDVPTSDVEAARKALWPDPNPEEAPDAR